MDNLPNYVVVYESAEERRTRALEINTLLDEDLYADDGTDYLKILPETDQIFTTTEHENKKIFTVSINFPKPDDFAIGSSDPLILSANNNGGLSMAYSIQSGGTGTFTNNLLEPTSEGELVIRAELADPTLVHDTNKPYKDVTIKVTSASRVERQRKVVALSDALSNDTTKMLSMMAQFVNKDVHGIKIENIHEETYKVTITNTTGSFTYELRDSHISEWAVSELSRFFRDAIVARLTYKVQIDASI